MANSDHSNRMDEVPDEYLADILPIAKKLARAMDIKDYNILQVSSSSSDLLASEHLGCFCRTTGRLPSSTSSMSTSTLSRSRTRRRGLS